MVVCLERGADLHMAQLMPLPLTVSCFGKTQIGFIFLVPPPPPGSPGQRAVKRVCVCVLIEGSGRGAAEAVRGVRCIRPRAHTDVLLLTSHGRRDRRLRRVAEQMWPASRRRTSASLSRRRCCCPRRLDQARTLLSVIRYKILLCRAPKSRHESA